MIKIWVDDIREAPEGWVWCTTGEAAVRHIKLAATVFKGLDDMQIEAISLDHDLGEGYMTGYDVVNYIEKMVVGYGYTPPDMYIHSGNPVGRENIKRAIDAITKRG